MSARSSAAPASYGVWSSGTDRLVVIRSGGPG